MLNIAKHLVAQGLSVKSAIRQLNELGKNLTLFVTDEQGKLVGTITDGDVRRGLVQELDLSEPVYKFMNKEFRYLQRNNYRIAAIQEFRDKGIVLIPVVDEEFRIIRLVNLNDTYSILPADVLIMAGGVGARLRPLTETVPKPMLKIGGKPILEHNIDRLARFGIRNIHVSVRYLADNIIDYFKDGSSKDLSIRYIHEDRPLGTIAALKQVEDLRHDVVLVMNSDLLTTIDYEDFYKQFEEDEAAMCIASIPYAVNIPYAVMEVDGNSITKIQEKPTYTYYSNAGIYLIRKSMIRFIPDNARFDATELINVLIEQGQKVSSYPIRGYWLDIGKMEDFNKAQEDIKHLKL